MNAPNDWYAEIPAFLSSAGMGSRGALRTRVPVPATGEDLDGLSDYQFCMRWAEMTEEDRSALPEELRSRCYQRYRALTPHVDATNKRLRQQQSRNAANALDRTTPNPKEDGFNAVRTASEIMVATSGPARYCVNKRVPCGVVIMGGRPKSRKSWYALQLGIAKAASGSFMGVETVGGRVLYIALEDNDRRMRQRLEFYGLTPEAAPRNLHLVYEWPTGLEGVEKLERWLAQHPDTVLIIIDVLQRFRGPRDPRVSAYEGDYQMMAMLHGVTQRHEGLTILVVHHVKKGPVDDPVEAISGTFGIAAAADAYVILRRGAEKDDWIAHIDGRDWESWDHDFLWQFLPQEGWRQVGLAEGITLTEKQKEVMDTARDEQYLTPTRLAELRGGTKQSAHEALQGLVSKGAMRVWSGRYYVNGE